MRLESIAKHKPAQTEYEYFKKAFFPAVDNARQLIIKPIEVSDKTDSGIYKPVKKDEELLPCGYVLSSNDDNIKPGDLVFWSTMAVFHRFEVGDLKAEGGKYIMMITHNIVYYFKGEQFENAGN